MSQFKTFVLPSVSDAGAESDLNGFLRSHRVVSVVKTYDGGSWRSCVEWRTDAIKIPTSVWYSPCQCEH